MGDSTQKSNSFTRKKQKVRVWMAEERGSEEPGTPPIAGW